MSFHLALVSTVLALLRFALRNFVPTNLHNEERNLHLACQLNANSVIRISPNIANNQE